MLWNIASVARPVNNNSRLDGKGAGRLSPIRALMPIIAALIMAATPAYATPTPTPTASPSPSPADPTPSPTPTASPTATASPSDSPTPTSTASPSPTLSPTPSPTPTLAASPTPTPSPSLTPSPSGTPTPTASPTPAGAVHDVEFVNDCSQPIWLAETNGVTDLSPPFSPGWDLGLAQTCKKSSECPVAGSKCIGGACTCSNKGAADAACGDGGEGLGYCQENGRCATSVTMKLPGNFPSGRFWGRTGCAGSGDTLTCETGNCQNSDSDNLADCYGFSANNATLWEETLTPKSSTDHYDISLVSGYNVPVKVVPSSPSCQQGGCATDLLDTCPPDLQYPTTDSASACMQANLFCDANPSNPICTTENKNFFNCSEAAQTDQLGEPVNLESPNAGTPICFDATDCPVKGTGIPFSSKCDLDPAFAATTDWPAGAGICIGKQGVIQNGGCQADVDDGQPCTGGPSFTFPYPDYKCATVINPYNHGQHVGVCLPPGNTTSSDTPSAYGNLIWNADNFTVASPQPTPGCAVNSDCSTGQYCLSSTVNKYPPTGTVTAQSVAQCAAASQSPTNGCECYNVVNCTTSADCTGGTQCLDNSGPCPADATDCVCETSSVLTGVCGPPNVNWQAAIAAVPLATPTPSADANYLNVFRNACPRAYSYQFDDQASLYSCANSSKLTNYKVTFCGTLANVLK
jgi:Thaumatin family